MPFVLQSSGVILHKNPQQLQALIYLKPKLGHSKVLAGMSGTTWVSLESQEKAAVVAVLPKL